MPELPDVESTRRYLVSQGLVGRTVSGVEFLLAQGPPHAFPGRVHVGYFRPPDSRHTPQGQIPGSGTRWPTRQVPDPASADDGFACGGTHRPGSVPATRGT